MRVHSTLLAISTALLLATGASAQQAPMMGEQDMQQMMAAMQKVQQCYQKIDQNEIMALQKDSENISTELRSLCKQGKRAEVEQKAIAYYEKMMTKQVMKDIKTCSEMLPASIKSMAQSPVDYTQYTEKVSHFCD